MYDLLSKYVPKLKWIQNRTRCTKMEPSWIPYLTKVASRWSKNGPRWVIGASLENEVIRTPPWEDFESPRAPKMSPDGPHGRTNSVQMEPI